VDAICHVTRCFDDENITHVEGRVDPLDDISTINLELILADLETVEKRIGRVEKLSKQKDKDAVAEYNVLVKLREAFENDKPARAIE
ncbi:redox-regulated ATPase YchF, partial [Escherichia coli]|nr:redox-regulated ATPase YchF [Escherichia coli]